MEQTIQDTLKRWETSLINFGKIDLWNINEDYSILCAFIAEGKSKAARSAVRECRDYSISGSCNAAILLSKVRNANRILNKPNDSRINRKMKKINSLVRQSAMKALPRNCMPRSCGSKMVNT